MSIATNRLTVGLTLAQVAAFGFFTSYLASSQAIVSDVLGLEESDLVVILLPLGAGLVSGIVILNLIVIAVIIIVDDEVRVVVLIIIVWLVGIIGSLYALFGGLRTVAVSDLLNGIGLLAGGLMITWFGLKALGDGSLVEVQGTAEGNPFTREQLGSLLEVGWKGAQQVLEKQSAAVREVLDQAS